MDTTFSYLNYLVVGLKVTLGVGVVSFLVSLVLSVIVGVARAERLPWVAPPLRIYVDLFRGTSLLVQLFWLFYCLPLIGISIQPFATGVLEIGLNSGAYGSEIVRGALLSVARHQVEAAKALGFGRWQALFLVALPQAMRETVPAFGNVAIAIVKDTSLVSLISLIDIAFRAQQLRSFTYDSGPIYAITLGIYFALAMVVVMIRRLVERGLSPPGSRNARL
jgi:polar amino acid transport system permease protein